MADVIKRVWRSGPRKVKRVAWGYTAQIAGKRVRVTNREWTEGDAEKALAERLLGLAPRPADPPAAPGITLGQATERYLATKEAERKRTRDDRYHLKRLEAFLGGAQT